MSRIIRSCRNCEFQSKDIDELPCKICFDSPYYPKWQPVKFGNTDLAVDLRLSLGEYLVNKKRFEQESKDSLNYYDAMKKSESKLKELLFEAYTQNKVVLFTEGVDGRMYRI